MPGDLCTAPRIISLSPLSLGTDVTDATLGASGLWLGTRTGAGGTATLTESFFWPQPMALWTTRLLKLMCYNQFFSRNAIFVDVLPIGARNMIFKNIKTSHWSDNDNKSIMIHVFRNWISVKLNNKKTWITGTLDPAFKLERSVFVSACVCVRYWIEWETHKQTAKQ